MGFIISMVYEVLPVGWTIFFINMLVHVILRGLWIGTIGLRYVAGEIDYGHFHYAPIFRSFLEKQVGSFDDFIEKLEKACSVIFSYTFLLFLLFLSFILFIAQLFSLAYLTFSNAESSDSSQLLFAFSLFGIFFILGFIVFIDFMTMGGLRKIKDPHVSKVYFWIYRLFSIITLSFLYRPLLYNFWDNKYGKRLFYFSIPYILIITASDEAIKKGRIPHFTGFTEVSLTTGKYMSPFLYESSRMTFYNANPERYNLFKFENPRFILDDYEIDHDFPGFFISYHKDYTDYLAEKGIIPRWKGGPYNPIFRDNRDSEEFKNFKQELEEAISALYKRKRLLQGKLKQNRTDIILQDSLLCIEEEIKELKNNKEATIKSFEKDILETSLSALFDYIHVYIDDVPINDSLTCFNSFHSISHKEGIRCHFPCNHLNKGIHYFTVKLLNHKNDLTEEDTVYTTFITIPFVKK